MGMEKIMEKVAARKKTQLPDVDDIQASLRRFKKPGSIEKKAGEEKIGGLFDKIRKAVKPVPKKGGVAGLIEKARRAVKK